MTNVFMVFIDCEDLAIRCSAEPPSSEDPAHLRIEVFANLQTETLSVQLTYEQAEAVRKALAEFLDAAEEQLLQ